MEEQNNNLETNTTNESAPKKKGHLLDALKRLGARIIDVFREYPVTMGAIIIAAFIGALMVGPIDYHSEAYKLCEKAVSFFLLLSFQTLTFEEIFKKKWPVRIIGSICAALFSLFCVYIFYSDAELLFGVKADTFQEILGRIVAVYCVFMVGFSIYHMFRRLEEDFETYATRAFLELLKASVIYGLFALGLAIIIWIFNELIFDTDDLLEMVEIFLAGGIYTPMCLKAISGKNEAPGKFFRFCILYVLQPMLLLAFAIIYIYFVKIFVADEIPSNQIFWILSFLFAVGMPIWTLIHGMEEKGGFLEKASKFLPYVFIPFVLLQCWSIGVRIGEYGVTPERYGAVILILCECIYFVLYLLHHILKKETISYLLFALMAVAFFGMLCPGTSYDDTVIRSQMKRIDAALNGAALDAKDVDLMVEIKSCYRVIDRISYKSKKVLEERFSEDEIEAINSFSEYNSNHYETLYLSDSDRFTGYDISVYRAAYPVSSTQTDKTSGKVSFRLQTRADDGSIQNEYHEVDLSELSDWAIANFNRTNAGDFSILGREKYAIAPDIDLIIDHITLHIDPKKKIVTYVFFEGFAMQK